MSKMSSRMHSTAPKKQKKLVTMPGMYPELLLLVFDTANATRIPATTRKTIPTMAYIQSWLINMRVYGYMYANKE
jgi:hypothetical protein